MDRGAWWATVMGSQRAGHNCAYTHTIVIMMADFKELLWIKTSKFKIRYV